MVHLIFLINIEVNHATLAQHTFQHELEVAAKAGMLGSIDANRGDYQNGWDTDQFPNNVPEVALALYYVLKDGGFTTGGLNFDAKIRRQSLDPGFDIPHGRSSHGYQLAGLTWRLFHDDNRPATAQT